MTSCGTLLWYQTEITNGELDVRWLPRSQDRSHQCLGSGSASANRSSAQGRGDQSQRSTGASWQQQRRICHSGRGLTPRIVTRKLFVTFNLPMRSRCLWTNQRTAYDQWGSPGECDHSGLTNLFTRHRTLYTSNTSPHPWLLESPSITFWLPIYHQYGEVGRNYPERERFEEFVCMFIPNKSLGSARGALFDCKWAVMIISTS